MGLLLPGIKNTQLSLKPVKCKGLWHQTDSISLNHNVHLVVDVSQKSQLQDTGTGTPDLIL